MGSRRVVTAPAAQTTPQIESDLANQTVQDVPWLTTDLMNVSAEGGLS